MWDSHCHLADFKSEEISALIAEAQINGVDGLISCATSFDDFAKNITIAKTYKNVYFCLGLHPLYLPDESLNLIDEQFKKYLTISNSDKLLAIGEIGLDFNKKLDSKAKERQINLFKYQLSLAENIKLPVVLHIQKAHALAISILEELQFKQGGLIHAFNSGANEAKRYASMGFKLGIGTHILRNNRHKLLDRIKTLNIEDLVLETDSPFMSPFIDIRNKPTNLALLASKLADILRVKEANLINIADENIKHVFNIKL